MSEFSYVICIDNSGHPASLELRKLYRVIDDEQGSTQGLLRVVDESGEDYLYPASCFEPVELSPEATRAVGESSQG